MKVILWFECQLLTLNKVSTQAPEIQHQADFFFKQVTHNYHFMTPTNK